MTFSLVDLDLAAAPLRALEGTDLAGVPRLELVKQAGLVAALKQAVDLLAAQVAGEIARRSSADEGRFGLARQHGFATPEQFVASVMGGPASDGARLVSAGRTLTPDTATPDAATPEREHHEAVAEALRTGAITVAKADLIIRAIDQLTGDTTELEVRLVRTATAQDYARLRIVCRTEVARFDEAQLEDRERRQAQARFLTLKEDITGVTHITGQLDPVRAAFVSTFIDAQVKAALQAKHDDSTEQGADDRTVGQIRADALVALAAHGLDCDCPATGVKATIITRVNYDDLAHSTGFATCDALSTPISASALRQIAVDASILPVVMGGASRVLDWGREHRLFTWDQRMALAERDGGCAKCHAPISHCITHHITWWTHDGTTDLTNGVLLCVRCHTQIHAEHWTIHIDDDNHVWFTPPPEIDPQQHRILGGLAALTTP